MTKEGSVVPVKVVVIGDGTVGKTCFLMSYVQRSFPNEYIPTIFDNHSADVDYFGKHVLMELYDTAGQEDYNRLRLLSYPRTDVFLVCYNITDPTTLNNVENRWVKELQVKCPDTPKILVGLKCDLREDSYGQNYTYVEESEVDRIKEACSFEYAVETSALKQINVDSTFLKCVEIAMANKKPPPPPCCTII